MPIFDNDGTTSREISKVFDNDGAANHPIGKVFDNDGTASHLIYSAEQDLTALTASSVKTAGFHPTGAVALIAATSNSYWDLSEYNSLKGIFSNTIEVQSWGAGGGDFENRTLHTYLKFNDGTLLHLFDGASATLNDINLSNYTKNQKSKVYLYVTRDVAIGDATNTLYAGEGKATNCIAY